MKIRTAIGSFPKVAPGTYRAEAYVKRSPDGPSPLGVFVALFDQSTYLASGDVPVDNDWQLVQVQLIVNQTVDLQVDVGGKKKEDGDCFLVDDVRLTP